jgi:hypothetical protein
MFRALLLSAFPVMALAQTAPVFQEQVIDDKIEIGYGLAVADVDGDGKTDVLLADKKEIVWYQAPHWKKHLIVDSLTVKDHVCIAARDIDGDGKCEIAVGAEWNPSDTVNSGAVFYLIPAAASRFEPWLPVRLTHEPTTHRMRWVRRPGGKHELIVLPLHGRGNKNTEGAPVKVLAYQMPADPAMRWTSKPVHEAMHATHNLEIIPALNSEPESILICGKEGVVRLSPTGEDSWHEQWITQHPVGDAVLKGAGEVRYGVLGGGRPYVATIEPMHGTQLCLYLPPVDGPKDKPWLRTVLTDDLVDGHALACYDFLGMGNRQIAVGWRSQQQIGPKVGVRLYSTTKEDGTGWAPTLLDDNTMACEDLAYADLDGDKDMDLIAAGRRTKNVKIYWNQRLKP